MQRGRKAPKLLAHEATQLLCGELCDTTHRGATARWLEIPATDRGQLRAVMPVGDHDEKGYELIYRHMSDREFAVLLETSQLPATQPYQTIVRGEGGFQYCLKYFQGKKKVDTGVTTIVAFAVESELVGTLFGMQSKIEDGAISHGLGYKGGKGLPLFNDALARGLITWRIRLVKRGAGARK